MDSLNCGTSPQSRFSPSREVSIHNSHRLGIVAMQHFEIRAFALTLKLFVAVCLLFATAAIALSQTPQLSISDVTLTEGDNPATPIASDQVKISLSAPSANTVSVTVSTQGDTAQSNVDFAAGSTVITFQPGETLKGLDVFPIGDTIVEGTERFFVNLSNPVNATIARGQGVATIIDDDALILLNQPSSPRADAMDSVLFSKEALPIINILNFSSDTRTRIIVFAIGWKGAPVTATAEDPLGNVFPLNVEFVDRLPLGNTPKSLSWLTEVVLKMPDPNQIPAPEDLKIRITSGQTSNAVLVAVKPQ